MRLFKPDKRYTVLYSFDGQEKTQELRCWHDDPRLDEFSARSRLGHAIGLDKREYDRIQVLTIIEKLSQESKS